MTQITSKEILATSEAARHWNSLTATNVKETICSGGGEWAPTDFTAAFGTQFVLDFGGGIGRNVRKLEYEFGVGSIMYYDLPGMLNLMPIEEKERYLRLFTEWNEVIMRVYHTVFASLVFQHIELDLLLRYLADLRRYSPGHRLLIQTRWYSDFDHQSIMDFLRHKAHYYLLDPNVALNLKEEGEEHWSAKFVSLPII